ncbi:high-affinity nickel permease [Fructobacillus pseudoficulneus]|uniref:Nickel/cobalt efflux system n=1 Tax=Fructobacillus pseudoficulneus TaxID=220714 RepID=A0A3F3GVY0_9LACO|nr:nickel permease [Fructobacillus pseudoficulneus]GAP02442.1 high-affinity nickel permease [Fructobacillus pseudoficulneus]SEH36922.1 high-affinity nickel-transport protein [Fructobacillus pseudoficulneus]
MTNSHSWKLDISRYGAFIIGILILGTGFLSTGMTKYPQLVGMAGISFTFGLRHAFDVDHIAAIDNMTRKMLNDHKNTRGVGFSFSFGHSLVVVLLTLLTVLFVEWADHSLPILESVGGMFGTMIAAVMLLLLACFNTFILRGIWKNFRHMKQKTLDPDNQQLAAESRIYRLFMKLLGMIKHNWQVAIVGFLFGLGFDTATQVAVLATSATATSAGVPWYAILSVPLFFTAGMCLMDTLDGFFMSSTYNWIISTSYRKVYFNLILTSISIIAAGFIGLVDLIQSLSAMFHFDNFLTHWAASLDFNELGIILVAIFILAWAVALLIWKVMNLSQYDQIKS